MLHHLKYRVIPPALPPRRIMLEIPGWSGDDQPRAGGSVQQPWHCTPFVEGATYGLELIYPFPNPCYVQKVDGEITILGDFGPDPQTGVAWPPIGVFNKQFYGFNTYTDVKAPPGFALRVARIPASVRTTPPPCRWQYPHICDQNGGRSCFSSSSRHPNLDKRMSFAMASRMRRSWWFPPARSIRS